MAARMAARSGFNAWRAQAAQIGRERGRMMAQQQRQYHGDDVTRQKP